MNLVDSCGWLEYLADGENADFYAQALQDVEQLLVPTICMYEVFKVVWRQRGEDAALQAVALLRQGQEAQLTGELALYAAKLSGEYRLPMADAVIYATCRKYRAVLWTQDSHFATLDHVKFIEKSRR